MLRFGTSTFICGCVNKETQKPGSGFYDVYDKKHHTQIKGNNFQEEKILKQTKREILECKIGENLLNI